MSAANGDGRIGKSSRGRNPITTAADQLRRGQGFARAVDAARLQILTLLVAGLVVALCLAVYVARLIVVPLRRVASVLRAVADKDLSQHANVRSRDELGQTGAALEDATTSLRATLEAMSANARVLASASEELTATSQHVTGSAAEAAEQVVAVVTVAEQMSHNAQAVAAGSGEMSASIGEIAPELDRGHLAPGRGDPARHHRRGQRHRRDRHHHRPHQRRPDHHRQRRRRADRDHQRDEPRRQRSREGQR